MKKNILYLIVILAMCQGMFAMETTQLERVFQEQVDSIKQLIGQNKFDEAMAKIQDLDAQVMQGGVFGPSFDEQLSDLADYMENAQLKYEQAQLQDIQELVNQHKYTEAYDLLNKFKGKSWYPETTMAAIKKVEESLLPAYAQELVNQHKYTEAYNVINEFKAASISRSEPYASGIKKLEELLFQVELKDVQRDVQQLGNQGKYEEAYNLLNRLKDKFKDLVISPSGEPYAEITKLEELLIQLQLKDLQQLVNQGKYKEAYDLLNWLKPLKISTSEPYASEIKKLEESLVKPQLDKVKQLANQHKYTEAYDILNRLKTLQVKQAWATEIQIKQQEAAWKKTQEPVAPIEQKWFFIKQIPGAKPVEKSDWKIQDQNLLLNLDATDVITSETFEDLIQQAQKDSLPFVLVMVQSGDATKFFPYFFAADIMKQFMQNWRKDNKFINPINREQVTNIEIYVMGDDKTLHLLKDKADVSYLGKLTDYKGFTDDPDTGRRTHNYELKPELTKPEMAKTFINNLYKEQGKPALFNL